MRVGILASHPIQYHAPWFRGLAAEADVEVFFAHRPTAVEQGQGFGAAFEWDVDLLSGYPHRFLRNVANAPSVSRFTGCDTPEIQAVITARSFDAFIVTGWHLKSYWQAVRACRKARVPVLVRGDSQLLTPRSVATRLVKAVTHRWLVRQFDGFLVAGERNRDYLLHYKAPPDRMFPVPQFVDTAWFASRAAAERDHREALRLQWGADAQTLAALFVGKFTPTKRPQDLLRALAWLRGASRRAVAVFVGCGELGPLLRAEARALQVEARFEGFRNQTDLPAYYVAADVLVLPSKGETWGLVVNEAMACGLPAVVSDVVGCSPDMIEEGRTGFTFPVGDTHALADRLEHVIRLRCHGWDFSRDLARKTMNYSLGAAVTGTVAAVETVAGASVARRLPSR